MKVCFPVQNNDGVQSMVFDHFGSAPMFLIVDTETRTLAVINNRDQHHAHGSCNPLKALDQQTVDAVIVGGIGGGALSRLTRAGISVFRAQRGTVQENLTWYEASALPKFALRHSCGGHEHGQPGGGCAHH
jgi:predicted Fe-Mo cluster-binding NifX family protein